MDMQTQLIKRLSRITEIDGLPSAEGITTGVERAFENTETAGVITELVAINASIIGGLESSGGDLTAITTEMTRQRIAYFRQLTGLPYESFIGQSYEYIRNFTQNEQPHLLLDLLLDRTVETPTLTPFAKQILDTAIWLAISDWNHKTGGRESTFAIMNLSSRSVEGVRCFGSDPLLSTLINPRFLRIKDIPACELLQQYVSSRGREMVEHFYIKAYYTMPEGNGRAANDDVYLPLGESFRTNVLR